MKPEKLSQLVVDFLTKRLQDEYNHHYFYQAASNWCNNVGFKKAGAYFLEESTEELGHARMIEQYLIDWNITPSLPTIQQPILEFSDLLSVIETAYNNEYKLYEDYEDSSMGIFKLGDLCVFDFLQFFRKAQKDSVATYSDMLNVLEGCNRGSKFEMLLLQEELF